MAFNYSFAFATSFQVRNSDLHLDQRYLVGPNGQDLRHMEMSCCLSKLPVNIKPVNDGPLHK